MDIEKLKDKLLRFVNGVAQAIEQSRAIEVPAADTSELGRLNYLFGEFDHVCWRIWLWPTTVIENN